PVIERSTWLSAARCRTAVGSYVPNTEAISDLSQMSVRTNLYLGLRAIESSDRRLAAYVNLSTLTTSTPCVPTSSRHTAEPINPAPPVTNTRISDPSLLEIVRRQT